ncbi:unnamed protein product [Amoebophrya sp. A25]|nr:unnamed protein product [Amoebophrya sp. A25]|eukprot:GSA25T00025944001.1
MPAMASQMAGGVLAPPKPRSLRDVLVAKRLPYTNFGGDLRTRNYQTPQQRKMDMLLADDKTRVISGKLRRSTRAQAHTRQPAGQRGMPRKAPLASSLKHLDSTKWQGMEQLPFRPPRPDQGQGHDNRQYTALLRRSSSNVDLVRPSTGIDRTGSRDSSSSSNVGRIGPDIKRTYIRESGSATRKTQLPQSTTLYRNSMELGSSSEENKENLSHSRSEKTTTARPHTAHPRLLGGKKPGVEIVPQAGDPTAEDFMEESEKYERGIKQALQAYVQEKLADDSKEKNTASRHRPRSASASMIKTQLRETIDDDEITSLFCEGTDNVVQAALKYKKARPQTADGTKRESVKPGKPWAPPGAEHPIHPGTKLRQKFLRSQSAKSLRPQSAWGRGPPPCNALAPIIDKRLDIPNLTFDALQDPGTKFRKMFERGDLPIGLKHGARMSLEWRVPVENVNVQIYLPVFLDGIRERKFPFNYVSYEGSISMIRSLPQERLLPALPEAMASIHRNMAEKDRDVICKCIKLMRELIPRGPDIGEAMIPFYKLFLPILNLFVCEWRNLGDQMDYAQRHEDGRNIAIMSQELLQLLERAAPENAFFNIKYQIPTYESCLQ